MSTEYNLDLHIPQKKERFKFFFSRMKKEELSFIFENSGSLTNNREKFMKRTTARSNANAKVWVELTIFFKTRTLGYFPDKYLGCCTFC